MNEQIQLLEDQIRGLSARKSELEIKEKRFFKVQGIEESIEKARSDMETYEVDLQAEKEELSELQAQKTVAVVKTTAGMLDAMNKFLPDGTAIIDINGAVNIGWLKTGDKEPRPYHALSGGEKAIFDSALAFVLLGDAEHKVIIIEAGEADDKNLNGLIKRINAKPTDAQILINCWHRPAKKPKGWYLEELGGQ